MASVKTHINRAAASVQLANTYAEDGALHSAARCLAQAAEHMQKAAERRTREIDRAIAKAEATHA